MTHESTPAKLGSRWPAEWEPHAATWMSWPHNRDTWPGRFEVIPERFAHIVRTIARFEPVNILAGGADVMAPAERHVGHLSNVQLFDVKTNDAWCRDHGPMFIRDGSTSAVIDWGYNAWGGKYPPFDLDNAVPAQVASLLQRRHLAPGAILEGGAIDGDGQGTILTTASCLLNPNRNPNLARADIEQRLTEYLGASHVLWLARGELAGDDTDGHIDQLARFCNAKTIAVAWEDDPADENHAPPKANIEQLQQMTNQDGEPFRIVKLPLPSPKFCQGQRLPASYCNFYIVNGAVIVPQFEDPADAQAIEILKPLFPTREIIGVPSLDLVWGLGSVHCLTQQEPA